MNKYQEALDYINKSICTFLALRGLKDTKGVKNLHILQEAVDKANEYDKKETPKKVIHECMQHPTINCDQLFDYYGCPNCNINLDHKSDYCEHCGQALDWSEYNEQISKSIR